MVGSDEPISPSNQASNPSMNHQQNGSPAPVSNVGDQQLQTQTSTDDEPLPTGWEVRKNNMKYKLYQLMTIYTDCFRFGLINMVDVIMSTIIRAVRKYHSLNFYHYLCQIMEKIDVKLISSSMMQLLGKTNAVAIRMGGK